MTDGLLAGVVLLWLLFSSVGLLLFGASRNVRFKRRYYGWYMAVVGVAVLVSFGALGIGHPMLLVMTPLVAAVVYASIRGTAFCDACGQTTFHTKPFAKPVFCSHCGSRLAQQSDVPTR